MILERGSLDYGLHSRDCEFFQRAFNKAAGAADSSALDRKLSARTRSQPRLQHSEYLLVYARAMCSYSDQDING